jgi:pimeloyl-ACP methyl ester carboxylesterase
MSYIKAPDGAALHYEIHGHGSQDLVFLHGVPGTGQIWRQVVESLDPAVFRSIVVDLRGHGRSEPGKNPVDYAQVHADLLLIADAVQSPSACWVTHSGSGKNGVWLAAHAPTRVQGLVLVAPTGCRTLPVPREAVAALAAASRDQAQMEKLVGQWFRLGCGPGYDVYLRSLKNTRADVLEQTMAMWCEVSVEILARRIMQPTLLVVGTHERIYTLEFLRENLLAVLPHARLETLEAGHLIPLDAPQPLAELLTRHCLATR